MRLSPPVIFNIRTGELIRLEGHRSKLSQGFLVSVPVIQVDIANRENLGMLFNAQVASDRGEIAFFQMDAHVY